MIEKEYSIDSIINHLHASSKCFKINEHIQKGLKVFNEQ